MAPAMEDLRPRGHSFGDSLHTNADASLLGQALTAKGVARPHPKSPYGAPPYPTETYCAPLVMLALPPLDAALQAYKR